MEFLINLVFWFVMALYLMGGVALNGRLELAYIQDFLRVSAGLGVLGLALGIDFAKLSFSQAFIQLDTLFQKRKMPSSIGGKIILGAALYLCALYLLLPLLRHWSFGSWYWDLGVIEHIVWRAAHGLGMTIYGDPPLAYVPNNHLN